MVTTAPPKFEGRKNEWLYGVDPSTVEEIVFSTLTELDVSYNKVEHTDETEMTYVVANRVFVKPEYSQEFEQRFKNRAGQINQHPGFVLMEVLKPQSENTPYVVMTHWEDEQAFQNWVGSDDFKVAHQNPMPKDAFLEGGGIEQYEVIISSKPA